MMWKRETRGQGRWDVVLGTIRIRLIVFVFLLGSTLSLIPSASWSASSADIQVLLNAARGSVGAHDQAVNLVDSAGYKPAPRFSASAIRNVG